MIIGIASLFLSDATAFPYELSANSTDDNNRTYEMVNGGARNVYITAFDSNKIDQNRTF